MKKPRKSELLRELALVKDIIGLLHPRVNKVHNEYMNSPKHIVIIPGLGASNKVLKPFIKCLERHGHRVYDWGLGVNDAGLKRDFVLQDVIDIWAADATGKAAPICKSEMGVPYLCTLVLQQVRTLAANLDSPIVLIGWSLGGYIARELARELPNQVSQVITFGTPTIGGPKYTAIADRFRRHGVDLDWIENEVAKRDCVLIHQPITAIIGAYDGIIHKNACNDHTSPNVEFHTVKASHLGLGFHYPLWEIVLKTLAK